MKTVFLSLVLLFPFSVTAVAQAPAQTRHPGIVLFEQAKFSEAIRSLEIASKSKEHKTDAEIWNYLGLSYLAKDEPKKSRKAFERSVQLNPSNSVFRANLAYAYLKTGQVKKGYQSADKAIQLDPKNAGGYHARAVANLWTSKLDPAEADVDVFIGLHPTNAEAYLLKSEILLAKLAVRLLAGHTPREEVGFLTRAAKALEQGVAKAKGSPRFAELKDELESISTFQKYYSRDPKPVAASTLPSEPEPGVTPIRILSKPRAAYTDSARTNNIQGTIRVAALMGTSGKVEHVLFLTRLGHGLERNVLEAVRGIRFEPKTVDGKPVPSVLTFEYGFSIY